jgi:DNA-binding CsgD family transcriptional regulator
MEPLRSAVTRLRAGRGSVLHLTGEAGIGKTTALSAARALLAGIQTRCADSEPYDRTRSAALVVKLLPEIEAGTDLVGLAVGCVERLALAGPLAVLADDVHWADADSLDVLSALARRAEDIGLLLLTTARPGVGQSGYEQTVDRFGRRLALGPLTEAETGAIVAARFGAEAGPALRAFLAEAGGNPFLVTELLDALAEHGDVTTDAGVAELIAPASLPQRLAERLVRRSISAAGDDGLVARAIAVVATNLHVDELATILDRPEREVLGSVLALVTSGVLIDDGVRLALRHDLIARAVAGATPAAVVRALNRRAVTALGDDAPVHRTASCLLAAADPHRPADTARLLEVGARLVGHHPLLAADLLRPGVGALDASDPRLLPSTLLLAAALVNTGRPEEALAWLEPRLDDPMPHPVRLHQLWALAVGMTGDLRAVRLPYTNHPMARLRDRFDLAAPGAADALAGLAGLLCAAGQPAAARDMLGWLGEHREGRSRYGLAQEHSARAWVQAIAGRFDEAVAESTQGIVVLADDRSPAAAMARPMLVHGIMLDNLGRGDEGLATLRRGQADPAPRWTRVLLQFATTLLLYRRGDWDDALAEIEAGLVAAEETGFGLAVCWPYALAAAIAAQRGNPAEARRQLATAAVKVTPASLGAELLGYAQALTEEAAGHDAAAAAVLARTARAVLAVPAPGVLVNFGADAVRLNRAADPALAREVTAAFEAMARPQRSAVVDGLAAWCRGLVGKDPHCIEQAATLLAAAGRTPQAARAWHDAAVMAAAGGELTAARGLADRAFAAYDTLGADQLHRRLRADLREIGLAMRPRRSPRRPAHGWQSLTRTETAIVELVAAGLTNTDIAARLFVSRRTVESHLARVYTKLGVHRRGELVAAMHRPWSGAHPVA